MDTININLTTLDMENINHIEIKKMLFIYNAIQNGWSVFKKDYNFKIDLYYKYYKLNLN